MSAGTRVVRNRIFIDDRHYDAKVLGGGKFDVFDAAGVRIGAFQVRGRAVEVEELGVEGADSVERIGLLWVRENLSSAPEPKPLEAPRVLAPPVTIAQPAPPAPPPPPAPAEAPQPPVATDPALRAICRVAVHNPPDPAAFKKAVAYQEWLRTQPGVTACYLVREPKTGKMTSVTVWADREKFAAMRYGKPPADAMALPALSVEISEVVG